MPSLCAGRIAAGVLLFALLAGRVASAQDGATLMIATVAGTGETGFSGDGGPARAARFNQPLGIAFDAAGNLYIGDTSNHRVRKISAATGIITTIAGTGAEENSGDGGPAIAAGLKFPRGLAFDAAGNLYITLQFSVRKVDAAGVISTFAGTGVPGFSGDGGPATAATMSPSDLAIDGAGNVYITGDNRVRKVTAGTGIIATVAGDGLACPHSDYVPVYPTPGCMSPFAIAVDRSENVYFTDGSGYTVRRLSADGVLTTLAGNGDGGIEGDYGPAVNARLSSPAGIAVDSRGDVMVWDRGRIRVISAATGRITTFGGRAYDYGPNGDGQPAVESTTFGLALALDARDQIYVLDADDAAVLTFVTNTHDRPLVGDMDGDGRADLVAWRPSTGTWFWLPSSGSYSYQAARSLQWGNEGMGDVPLLGDVDGDGRMDPIVWRASTGTWWWLTSSSGYDPAAAGIRAWGNRQEGDVPLLGDIDGDRRVDLTVWRASTGTFYWLTSSSGFSSAAAGSRQWGSGYLMDVPMLGDVDGDSRADLLVWRRSVGNVGAWLWLTSSSGYTTDRIVAMWQPDLFQRRPFLADMDGDRRADLVTWNGQTGMWEWLTAAAEFSPALAGTRQWGTRALLDQPLLGDIDGDGLSDPIVWRLSTGTWYWLARFAGQVQWGR